MGKDIQRAAVTGGLGTIPLFTFDYAFGDVDWVEALTPGSLREAFPTVEELEVLVGLDLQNATLVTTGQVVAEVGNSKSLVQILSRGKTNLTVESLYMDAIVPESNEIELLTILREATAEKSAKEAESG